MMKAKTKELLRNRDLPKYCEQIGIRKSAIPYLIFSRKTASALHHSKGHRRSESKDTLGRCFKAARIIYVAERTPGNYVTEEKPTRRKGWLGTISSKD